MPDDTVGRIVEAEDAETGLTIELLPRCPHMSRPVRAWWCPGCTKLSQFFDQHRRYLNHHFEGCGGILVALVER